LLGGWRSCDKYFMFRAQLSTFGLVGLCFGLLPGCGLTPPNIRSNFTSTQASPPSESPAFLPRIWDDTKAIYLSGNNWLYFGVGLGFGLGLDSVGLEDNLAGDFDRRDYLPESVGNALDQLGTGIVLLGGTAAWYGYSALTNNQESLANSKTMASSLIITGISTLGLKALIQDERPNGVPEGFPSGHAAMSMAAATTLAELYGWKVGVPAVLISGLVGFQRLDSRVHDLDDVIAGWTLGWVIASTVAGNHQTEILGAQLVPILDPIQSGIGLGLSWQF
jgi:PAP2 superfamily